MFPREFFIILIVIIVFVVLYKLGGLLLQLVGKVSGRVNGKKMGSYNEADKEISEIAADRETNGIFDDSFEQYEKQRGKWYVPIESNKQIGQIAQEGSIQKYYALSTRITMAIMDKLIQKGMKKRDARREAYRLTHKLLTNYRTDADLYREIAKIAPDAPFDNEYEDERAKKYAEQIAVKLRSTRDSWLPVSVNTPVGSSNGSKQTETAKQSEPTKQTETALFPPDAKVMDIGCGTCKVVDHIAQILNMKPYGCDLKSWSDYNADSRSKNINFTEVEETGPLPFADEEFDLILLNMSLHHMKDAGARLKEIRRITKKNGIVFIRDHSIFDDFDSMLVDIDHVIREFKQDTTLEDQAIKNCNGTYWHGKELDALMSVAGFDYIKAGEYLMTCNINIQFNKSMWGIYRAK